MLLSAIAAGAISMSAENFDLVIVGATPGGIMTAVEAARMGKSSVIL